MADLNQAFTTRSIPIHTHTNQPVYGYICRVCGGCHNYHRTRVVQNRNPHEFIKGTYRELLTFEQYPFDDETGCSYVN